MEKRKVTKSIPHACPVCKGRGELGEDLAQHESQPKYDGFKIYACHVCDGTCMIWEYREEEVEEHPNTLQPWQPQIVSTGILPGMGLPPLQIDPQDLNVRPYMDPYPYNNGPTWTLGDDKK